MLLFRTRRPKQTGPRSRAFGTGTPPSHLKDVCSKTLTFDEGNSHVWRMSLAKRYSTRVSKTCESVADRPLPGPWPLAPWPGPWPLHKTLHFSYTLPERTMLHYAICRARDHREHQGEVGAVPGVLVEITDGRLPS